MLNLIFLSEKFYCTFQGCKEIEEKTDRPYVMLEINIDGVLWGIPLRSHIKHPNAIWTDKKNGCGIDLSKAVVLSQPDYIDRSRKPYLRENEFAEIKKISEYVVREKMKKYIERYKEAKSRPQIARNRLLVKYSTLQYFETYI